MIQFHPSRSKALEQLQSFVENHLGLYARDRNFDFGPEKRTNTSCLSPYVTHGILSENEIIKQSLKQYSFSKIEKFIQEVLWRTYWKGWLERRPSVWTDFINDLKYLKVDYESDKNLKAAVNGNTDIECFNDWVHELKDTGYLHNHTRMWFSSIWIFTLELPWQLGAEFFMRYLKDGDPASNTLSWRWTAGVQTKGKNYVAQKWNIKKFTNGRYEKVKLNENAVPIVSDKDYVQIDPELVNADYHDQKTLVIFDNQLSFETSDFNDTKFKKILIMKNNNLTRSIELDENLMNFKNDLLVDQENRLKDHYDVEVKDISFLNNLDTTDMVALYPGVGENLDFLNQNQIQIPYLFRSLDQMTNKYCNKGFFNFKNFIPKIISQIDA
ncbi:MAG: DNA photolyase [Pelagibacteraceae bacterium]|nr:DNA photolyase [Pelagibacteraceae bacterium]MCI5079677.1 DNA photolyase [Pelagibacteraceae bacterium]